GALLRSSLSQGALKAGVETLTQATASTVATTQLGELAIAAAAAAAALQSVAAAGALGGAGSGAGGGPDLLSAIFAPGSGTPFASGGIVSGPGGSRSDGIPAFLSDGEFVVNTDATRRHRRLLEAVNKGNRLFGLDIFRDGGLATTGIPDIPPIRRGPAPAPTDSALALRPIVNHFHGVSDFGSFQRNMPQFRGPLREMISRAEKRDD
ncbi:MAG: hypothetical protein R3285_00870, partial [Kiloniellales bacterium]|nr:hypothetical protein [Kiloniellales bacterium]